MSQGAPKPEPRLGLAGATSVGVAAIVGGGVLVLAGPAFIAAGPAAILAFALNGILAFLTAMSFAEMSTQFPENGGAYTYAKKVLSVQAAFGAGWVLWFAYIVAGVLYALGFAEYTSAALAEIFGWGAEGESIGRAGTTFIAIGAVAVYTLALARRAGGGGRWATGGKLVVFVVFILAGMAIFLWTGPSDAIARVTPFAPSGMGGVIEAMGLTFIAFQGFDSVATVAGEVREPRRVIPRAMKLSLAAALIVYLPLLFIVATLGTHEGESIAALSAAHPETVVAVAARRFMGDFGYWLVIVAALLSTLTALQANLLAASRVAFTMAQDRTLPRVMAEGDPKRGTPLMAIYATALAAVAILLMVRDLGAAGAAASLIFLVAFAMAHVTSFLARQRLGDAGTGYRSPAFPLVPILGGGACAGMAVFQAVTTPSAGSIALVWLGFGAILYYSIFRTRARTVDALHEAHDPALARLRGRSPLVLVPVANPETAAAMAAIGNALAAPAVGRVLLLSVVPPASDTDARDREVAEAITRTEQIMRAALIESLGSGHAPETLITVSDRPWEEIRRVAGDHGCESMLLGLSSAASLAHTELERLLNRVASHAVILRAPEGWRLRDAQRILVAIGGKGRHDELRARMIGSLTRLGDRRVTYARVVPRASEDGGASLLELRHFADEETPGGAEAVLVTGENVTDTLCELADSMSADLVIMGTPRSGGRKSLGRIAIGVASQVSCATLMICRESTVSLALDRLGHDLKLTVIGGGRGG